MIMLSTLRHFDLVDDRGERARLRDLAIELEEDYPPVTQLLFRNARGEQLLPWSAVQEIRWKKAEIKVANLDQAGEVSQDDLIKITLLHRDVIDALVLDLHNRRATRANDLWLEMEDAALLLKAADTSVRAILRRLSRGHFGRKPSRAPYDWKYIEFLRGDPHAAKKDSGYRLRIGRLPAGEIAGLSRALPYLHAAELITILPDALASRTLEAMLPARRLQVFQELDDTQALSLLALMAPDDAADLLGRIATGAATAFLEKLPADRREKLIELLRYPEDTVGGIMTNDVVTLPLRLTVQAAREPLRQRLKAPEFTYFIYIVEDDETRVLRGTVRLSDFVRARDEQTVEELMNPYTSTLDPLEPADIGSYRLLNGHMAALPVIAEDCRLLGIVTVDAAVLRVAPPSWSSQAPRVFS